MAGQVCLQQKHLCFHLYPTPEGASFRATYAFHSECEIPGCFAAIEVAENLEAITFNGEPLKPSKLPGELGPMDPQRSWKDINFTRVPLPAIRKGTNTLVLDGKKVNNVTGPNFHRRLPDWREHRATEAEEVYILGRFSVRRLSDGLYGLAPFREPPGKNLTYEGFPF